MFKFVNPSVGVQLITSACASTNVNRLGSTQYPPKPVPCNIDVLTTTPKQAYEEVCMLNARGGQSMLESKTVEGLLPDLKKSACACGADAIILKDSKEGGYNFGQAADRASASATAIKFK